MKDQKITKASLLQSKAKMMADRNERFALFENEVQDVKEEILDNLTQISDRISKFLNS